MKGERDAHQIVEEARADKAKRADEAKVEASAEINKVAQELDQQLD